MTNAASSGALEMDVTLNGGSEMPLLGFGTWQITGREAVDATVAALRSGYRHLDTATVYENEAQVGEAIRDSGVSRDDLFITTKLPPERAGGELETLRESLKLLDTDHVDLWLIHWPPDSGVGADIWRAFAEARELGLAKEIGVSNYSLEEIDELSAASGVPPAVNQIEWSPLLFDASQLEGHRERGIILEGYSGLRGGVLDSSAVIDISHRREVTPAQVVIRWHLQHGVVVIPKSRNPDRIRANADVSGFELSLDEMQALDRLSQSA